MEDRLTATVSPDGGGATERSTVLLLMGDGENRALLKRVLQDAYVVLSGGTHLHDREIDLVVTDTRHVEDHWEALRQRKTATDEVFLPVLLITTDERLSTQDLRYFELVDELLPVPLTRVELRLRLRLLERTRTYSESAARRNRDLEQVNALLAERERYYRMLFENSRDAIILTTPEGRVVDANPAADRMFGFEEADLEALDVRDFYVDRARRGSFLREVAEEDGLEGYEVRMKTKHGAEFVARLSASVHRSDDGELESYQVILRDVSHEKLREEELIRARHHAEEMSELKSAFLANMSHEIRTPLASIIGFADLLADKAPDSLSEFVELIRDSGQRLLVTLDSVLDLAQLESGSLTVRPEETDMGVTVRDIVHALSPGAQKKGLRLQVEVPEGSVPAIVDRGVVTRVLTNLVQNAIKFTEKGRVAVTLHLEGEELVLEVADTGVGITEEELPHLFDAFRQESKGMEREFEGSGLGLTITRQLVDLVDGSISVESEKGEGTTFTVRLPRRLEGRGETSVNPSLAGAHEGGWTRCRRISGCWPWTTTPRCWRSWGRCCPTPTGWRRRPTRRRPWRGPASRSSTSSFWTSI